MNREYNNSDTVHKIVYWVATAILLTLMVAVFIGLVMVAIWMLMGIKGVMFG